MVATRRALLLTLVLALAMFGLTVPLAPQAAGDAAIIVRGECTLADAVVAANTAASFRDCANGSGSRTIRVWPAPVTVDGEASRGTLLRRANGPTVAGARTALPAITSNITIEGINQAGIFYEQGVVVVGDTTPRLATVAAAGSLTLRDLTISGFRAVGSTSSALPCPLCNGKYDVKPAADVSGGAIHALGDLTLERTVLIGNQAVGGSSGLDGPFWTGNPDNSRAASSGGSAYGGAIYAAGQLAVVSSVFAENAAVGADAARAVGLKWQPGPGWFEDRDGGDGGAAHGADIYLAGQGRAFITDTVFEDSAVLGGDGRYGFTPQSVKDLQPAADGTPGTDANTALCTQTSVNGGDATNGANGLTGAAGGDGGDAIGVVAGAGTLRLSNSAITGSLARAGSAGEAAIPGLGGGAASGGDAVSCIPRGSVFPINGTGGDASRAGAHGLSRGPGERGTAVSTIDARFAYLLNVTMHNTSAKVPADAVEPGWSAGGRAEARELALRKNTRVHPDGATPGCLPNGTRCGALAKTGEPSVNLEPLEASSDPGGAYLMQRSTHQGYEAEVKYSTIADADFLLAPGNGRTTAPPVQISATRVGIKASILSGTGLATCSALNSLGGNIWESEHCTQPWQAWSGAGTQNRSDFQPIAAIGALRSTPVRSGPVLATSASGQTWQMLTRIPGGGPTNPVGPAGGPYRVSPVDRVPWDWCFGDTGNPAGDARRAPRVAETACDAGAHEINRVVGQVDIDAPDQVVAERRIQPGGVETLTIPPVTVAIPVSIDGAATAANLAVQVSGFDGAVDFGTGAGTERSWTFELPDGPLDTAVEITLSGFTAPQSPTVSAVLDVGTAEARAVGSRLQAQATLDYVVVDAADPVEFVPTDPVRYLDTRTTGTKITAGTTLQLPITGGPAQVPTNAKAVALNVTVTEPANNGYLTVHPCGTDRPNASNLNYIRGQTIPNAVTAKIGTNGSICLYASRTTHAIVDLNGWYPAESAYAPADPVRYLDTRTTGTKITAGTTLQVPITGGPAQVPTNAKAVALNVTVTEPANNGYLTVHPCGTDRPNASNLNYIRGQTIPNAVTAKIGTNSSICLYASRTTHAIVDLNGWHPG